tara:strand:+ start:6950 stop:9001 length:2052 start_codon:yes stop_codon:yes gene_type:complete
MTIDSGFFSALTGPMLGAGDLQNARLQKQNALKQQQMQLQMQELAQLNRKNEQNNQLVQAQQTAFNDLYTNNKFARQKDVDDFKAWHQQLSGWNDIQGVLREHGSIDNARLYGNLDYLIAEYQARLKNNPISQRTKKNQAALELYHSHALNNKYSHLITTNAKKRYTDFVNGESDNFIFNAPRRDYIEQAKEALSLTKAQNLDIDDLIGSNHQSIIIDMINDANPENVQEYQSAITYDDMKLFVKKELGYQEVDGVTYFNGQAIFGDKEIDTTFSRELVRNLDSVGLTQIATGKDFFKFKDQGINFQDMFNSTDAFTNWDRIGGVDKNHGPENYKGISAPFSKGTQLVASPRIFAFNPKLETAITRSWAGKYSNSEESRYNTRNRQVDNVRMAGLYDRYGHQISDSDIASMNITGKDLWQESERDDLRLRGYHVALEGKNANGDSFLLTDVSKESDLNKMREQYKNTEFDYVIVAELIDDDLGPDDAYYKKINLEDATIQAAINEAVPTDDLNKVKTDMGNYEQQIAQQNYANQRKIASTNKLTKQLEMPNEGLTQQFVNGYDKTLNIGLSMSGVSSFNARKAIPMIMADLYVQSKQERNYPFDFTPNETDPSKKLIANSPGQYMALSTKLLKEGLATQNPNFVSMLEAINKGNYDQYSQTIYPASQYKQSRKLSKTIYKYQQ